MITKEQILEAQKEVEEKAKPLNEIFKIVKADHDNKVSEIEKPLLDLIETYYDENLRDKNDVPVKNNSIITNGKSKFYIHNRGMQFFFGIIIFNPRVMGKKIDDEGIIKPKAREVHIGPSELKEYWII